MKSALDLLEAYHQLDLRRIAGIALFCFILILPEGLAVRSHLAPYVFDAASARVPALVANVSGFRRSRLDGLIGTRDYSVRLIWVQPDGQRCERGATFFGDARLAAGDTIMMAVGPTCSDAMALEEYPPPVPLHARAFVLVLLTVLMGAMTRLLAGQRWG